MIPITHNNRRVSGMLSFSLVSMEMQRPSKQTKLLPRAAPSWMYDAYSNKERQQQIKQTSCCAREIISLRVLAFALGFYIPTIQTQEDNLAERMFEKAQVKLIWKVSLADSKVGCPRAQLK
jgi:hypothetical protein